MHAMMTFATVSQPRVVHSGKRTTTSTTQTGLRDVFEGPPVSVSIDRSDPGSPNAHCTDSGFRNGD